MSAKQLAHSPHLQSITLPYSFSSPQDPKTINKSTIFTIVCILWQENAFIFEATVTQIFVVRPSPSSSRLDELDGVAVAREARLSVALRAGVDLK